MKKLISMALAGAMLCTPAFAMTIEFKRDSGETQVVKLDGEGAATLADGTMVPYTYDAETKKMCFEVSAEQKPCVVFAEHSEAPMVGDTVRYKADDGAEGTATVIEA